MLIIVNPRPPKWVLLGHDRPPEYLRKYCPKEWERQLMIYGQPGEIGKYFAEEMIKKVHMKFKLQEKEGNHNDNEH